MDTNSINPGPIRHQSLPDTLLRRIRAVHAIVRDSFDVTLEQFEITFMRDTDPESEVQVWESIAQGFVLATEQLPDLNRKSILRTLLAYSMDALTPNELADPDVRRVVELIEPR